MDSMSNSLLDWRERVLSYLVVCGSDLYIIGTTWFYLPCVWIPQWCGNI